MVLKLLVVALAVLSIAASTWPGAAPFDRLTDNMATPAMQSAFTRNEGQWDSQVLFRGNVEGAEVWFTDHGIYYEFARLVSSTPTGPDPVTGVPRYVFQDPEAKLEQLVVRTVFEGAKTTLRADGQNRLNYVCNYYLGNDPSAWRENVSNFSEVYYTDVYPGIDIRYFYSARDLEYDFVVNPGADPSLIAVKWDGPNEITVNTNGELIVNTSWGTVKEHAPLIYQSVNGKTNSITGRFRMTGPSTFGFELSSYDPNLPLIIDPVLQYSTYLGGMSDDIAYGLAVDPNGNMYVTGATKSASFPVHNAYDSVFTGSNVTNVFVTKLSAGGNSLVYSTFLGGGGGTDEGRDIAVTVDGSAYITGRTSSSAFPVLDYFDNSLGGTRDAFVTKLSPTGSLSYSTFLGGTVIDEGYGIAVDAAGNAYVTGSTNSANFPVANALDAGYNGQFDVFVTKLAPTGSTLVFSTFFGGSASEQANGIALDGFKNVYIAGFTSSTNLPKLNAYDSSYNGADDIFVAKIAAAGKPLLYSTYLGSIGSEQASAIAVGPYNTAFITGYTTSGAFPTKSAVQPVLAGGTDAIIARIDATGSSLVYSTFLGGTSSDYGYSIAIDSKQQAYIAGATLSSNFPVLYAYDSTANGGDDLFISKVQSTGGALIFSTLLGGSGYEEAFDMVLDANLSVYVTGATTSTNYPTIGAFDSSLNGGYDAFVSKMAFEERACCTGMRGNIDGDPLDAVDIADLVFLVNYSFSVPAGPEPPCQEEADVDGSGTVDVADLIFLVDYMFTSGAPAPVSCP